MIRIGQQHSLLSKYTMQPRRMATKIFLNSVAFYSDLTLWLIVLPTIGRNFVPAEHSQSEPEKLQHRKVLDYIHVLYNNIYFWVCARCVHSDLSSGSGKVLP